MAEKFWTTGRKKMLAAAGLGITGWHALTMGANQFNIPALPGFIGNPLLAGISLLNVAGAITIFAIVMIYTEY